MGGVVLDLLAQGEDIIVDRARFGCFFEAPHVSQETIARYNLPFVREEILEQLKFTGVGFKSLSVFEQFVTDKVDANRAENDNGTRRALAVTTCKSRLDKNLEYIDLAFGNRCDGISFGPGFSGSFFPGFHAGNLNITVQRKKPMFRIPMYHPVRLEDKFGTSEVT